MALNPNRLVLKKDTQTGEWAVRVYLDGKYNEEHTYYTDSRADAEATMADMQGWLDSEVAKRTAQISKRTGPRDRAYEAYEKSVDEDGHWGGMLGGLLSGGLKS